MNPYDFIPIDTEHQPDRRPPVWHHTLMHAGTQKLYSGNLYAYIKAETPLFIRDSNSCLCKIQTVQGHIFRISKVNTLFQAPLSKGCYAVWLRHSVEAALQFFATPTTILNILYQMASHVARTTRRFVLPAVSLA